MLDHTKYWEHCKGISVLVISRLKPVQPAMYCLGPSVQKLNKEPNPAFPILSDSWDDSACNFQPDVTQHHFN